MVHVCSFLRHSNLLHITTSIHPCLCCIIVKDIYINNKPLIVIKELDLTMTLHTHFEHMQIFLPKIGREFTGKMGNECEDYKSFRHYLNNAERNKCYMVMPNQYWQIFQCMQSYLLKQLEHIPLNLFPQSMLNYSNVHFYKFYENN